MAEQTENFPHPSPDSTPETAPPSFEDMSLWELAQLWIMRPLATTRALLAVVVDSDAHPLAKAPARPQRSASPSAEGSWLDWVALRQLVSVPHLVNVVWLLTAVFLMRLGAGALYNTATDPIRKAAGDTGSTTFWVLFSLLVYGGWVVYRSRDWWLPHGRRLLGQEVELPSPARPDSSPAASDNWQTDRTPDGQGVRYHQRADMAPAAEEDTLLAWLQRHSLRLMLVPAALVLAWYAYDRVAVYDASGRLADVVFTPAGLQSWLAAIALWVIILGVDLNGLAQRLRWGDWPDVSGWRQTWQRLSHWRWPHTVLLVILLVAAYFRLHDLAGVPSAMTSDHLEKMRDALRVEEGYYAIFFPNNGGREAFQMYVIQQLATTFDLGFSFTTLKIASAIEGLIAVVLMFFTAKTVIGRDTREKDQLGDWVGLAAAGLLAISAWQTMISRLGLRIPLTPIAAMLITIFLVRAVRHNRRADFIGLGLTLGISFYWYQSNRLLPVYVALVVGLAVLAGLRRQRQQAWAYLVNIGMAGLLAFVIYLPMLRYAQAYPVEFWSRAYGRIYGDNVYGYCEFDPATGQYEVCAPNTLEMSQYLLEQRQALIENYKDAFLMFGWEGDPGWFQNARGLPALDPTSNALLMLGAAMWLVYMVRRREMALVVVPIGLLVMMLPSVLTIAQAAPEHPSFTRISGITPFVFLLAGFPLGVLAREVVKAGYTRVGAYGLALLLIGGFVYNAAPVNWQHYFEDYRASYERSWRAYDRIAQPLVNFVEGEGSFSNAFYVHSPHWLDHRILGAMAGDIHWPNSIDLDPTTREPLSVYAVIRANQGTPYQYNPEQPLLFMIHSENQEALAFFPEYFPGGRLRLVRVDEGVNDFYVYEAPPGWQWLGMYMTEQIENLACMKYCGPLLNTRPLKLQIFG